MLSDNVAVAAVALGADRLDVFGVGDDAKMQHKWWEKGNGWYGGPTFSETVPSNQEPFMSPPAALGQPNGGGQLGLTAASIEVFAVGENALVYSNWCEKGADSWQTAWINWYELPELQGWISTRLAVVCHPSPVGPARIDVFGVGEKLKLNHIAWHAGLWVPGWESLDSPVSFQSAPAAVSWAANRLDVFVIGNNAQMYHRAFTPQPSEPPLNKLPGSWESLDSPVGFQSAPAAVSWGANRLDVFGVGEDQKMYHNKWAPTIPTNTHWQGWQALPDHSSGGASLSFPADFAPSAVSWGTNRVDVFGIGKDFGMYHNSGDGNQWQPQWNRLGGRFRSAPTAVSRETDRLDVFGIGDDQSMFHNYWDGTAWQPNWQSLGGPFRVPLQ